MKKPLIIGVSVLTLLTLSSYLFAQTTTGSSLISEMKAAVRNFTLASDLNPGETGLQSSPLSGKKTGDMLTAGEYNRILELVGQGGGGAGGQSDIILAHGSKKTDGGTGSVSVTDTITLTQKGLLIISGNAERRYNGAITNSGGRGSLYIDNVACASDMGFEGMSTTMNFYSSPSCTQMLEPGSHTVRFDNVPLSTTGPGTPVTTSMGWAVIAEKVSGGGGGSGGGSGWVDVPLTDTANFDIQCEYRYTGPSPECVNGYRYADFVGLDRLHSSADRYVYEVFANKKNYARGRVQQTSTELPEYSCTITSLQKRCEGGGGGGGLIVKQISGSTPPKSSNYIALCNDNTTVPTMNGYGPLPVYWNSTSMKWIGRRIEIATAGPGANVSGYMFDCPSLWIAE